MRFRSVRSILLYSLFASAPLAQAQTAPTQSLVINWNLVGNSSSATIDPVSLFGNQTTPVTGVSSQINTVWKWNTAAGGSWLFYAPSFDAPGLASYAAGKSYGVLSSIASGDGYWVNAKSALTLTLPSGTASTAAIAQALTNGWNLVANNSAVALDPVVLFGNKSVPLSGVTSQVTTVWKWDAVKTAWQFYTPTMTPADNATYAASKTYDVLTTILPGEGYWINTVAALSLALPPVISGTAASGAPLANATITLTCGDGSTRTSATDASGNYSIGLANCSAPYVVSAMGNVGDTRTTMVSFMATSVPSGTGAVTVNVTPLTHALAATLASTGDPLDLAANYSTEKAGITETAVNQRKGALVAALADTLKAVNLDPATFDIVATAFKADRSGMDKVLDNVKVEVTGASVNITNVAGAKADDMAEAASGGTAPPADLSSGSISISNKTDFAAALPKLPADLDDNSVGDTIRDLLNACFAQPAATRGSFATTLSDACKAVPIDSTYKHDGRSASGEFDRFLTNAAYDNAKFARPEIIRFFSSTPTDTRALIKFSLQRTDGMLESFMTVGEKSDANTAGQKKLRGNQRPFKVFVNGYATKRVQIEARGTTPKSTYFSTGINLYFGFKEGGAGGSAPGLTDATRKVDHVKVTGPGLPAAGVMLTPKLAGCDSYYAITPVDSTTGVIGNPLRCTSLFRMSSRAVSATDTDNFNNLYGQATRPEFAAAKVSDAKLVAIKPFSLYKFEVWRSGNATATPSHVFFERLRSRPITMGTVAAKDGEIDRVRWNTIADETIAAINPLTTATVFAGGNPSNLPVKWTNLPNTAPTYNLQVQTNPTGSSLFQDQVSVAFSANSVVLANGTQGWPNLGTTGATTSGAFNLVQLVSRNIHDTQLFADWIY